MTIKEFMQEMAPKICGCGMDDCPRVDFITEKLSTYIAEGLTPSEDEESPTRDYIPAERRGRNKLREEQRKNFGLETT